MDELLKALAQAVREGTSLAYPAIVGYYIVRVIDTVVPTLTVLGCFMVVARMILKLNIRGYNNATAEIEYLKYEMQKLRNPPTPGDPL